MGAVELVVVVVLLLVVVEERVAISSQKGVGVLVFRYLGVVNPGGGGVGGGVGGGGGGGGGCLGI